MMAPPPRGPVVRLNADSPAARLQIMRYRWMDVCTSPCGVIVDPAGTYRVGGGTVRPSEQFAMPRPVGVVQIDAQVGSTVKHWVGFGLIIGGIASAAAGGLFLAAASDTSSTDVFGNSVHNQYKVDGYLYLITGVIMTAIGIPLAMSSTSVDVR
jgi:hypothetical protein